MDSYQLPAEITSQDELDEILLHLVKNGGSEVFIDGGDYMFLQIHSRNYILGDRKISITEAEAILSIMNGEEAVAKIKGGEPDNPSYEIEEIVEVNGLPKQLRHRFRVNAVITQRRGRTSPCITIREISHTPPHYSDIGVSDDEIKKFLSLGVGIGLVIGPTGSGKTTLLASIAAELLQQKDNMVVTLEEPIEYAYDSIKSESSRIRQIEIGGGVGDFPAGVRNCMRMKPSHIIIGESRDYETISAATESALTGHGVMTTVHAGRVSEAIDRMIMRYPVSLREQAKLDIVSVLKFACAQRLVKSTDGKRVAVREKIFLTEDLRKKIMKSDRVAEKVDEIVSEHGISFKQDLIYKMNEGVISEEECSKYIMDMYGEEI